VTLGLDCLHEQFVDLDDVGAEIAKHHGAVRTGEDSREIKHDYIGEDCIHDRFLL